MPEQEQEKHKPEKTAYRRDEEFETLYANNVYFELSAWDLKIIFGQLDQSKEVTTIEQHTAMVIPWAQAKLMSYLLQVNIAIYESDHGKIKLPTGVLPKQIPPPENATAQEKGLNATIEEMRQRLILEQHPNEPSK